MASRSRSSSSIRSMETINGSDQSIENTSGRPKGKSVGNVVLVFGCQWLSFDAGDFRRLRATVLDNPEHHWMIDVLGELPTHYRTAAGTGCLPSLNTIPGETELRELDHWFRCDDLSMAKFPLSYTQLAPLLMMTHIVQYGQYLKLTKAKPGCKREAVGAEGSSAVVEIVGFCIGLLSGVVVSAARNQEQLRRWGAVALRLAILLGALGDVQEKEEEYTSLATAWRTADAEEQLDNILDKYPGSYTTVRYDENRATVMAPRKNVVDLQQSLQSAGFTATSVDFNGRYHWPGHKKTLSALFALCKAEQSLQLPDASELIRPLRTNTTAELVRTGPLHEIVLRAVLAERCVWYTTFSAVYQDHLTGSNSLVVEFGPERCIPPSFLRRLPQRVIHFADLELPKTLNRDYELASRPPADTDIAIVGMACRVAGADDLNEFWDLLCAGKSQQCEMPRERYADYETPWRPEASKRTWLGNFVRDIDAFDHKFFKKSPREAMSQDPQQRLIFQVAYQALESAGYFSRPSKDKDIGCYIASCTVDYEHNVNCHTASAYAATGLLRSFLAGKISHYFGWRGPSLCIDTACSGSAVALHHACRAILNGDCRAALVGGANAITSPLAYDNLAGASFLSPTGACRPFDAQADGYCRGEGFVATYVKKLSDALENGDNILATIAGTAVEQNDNCTPIVVPDAPSLAGLFKKVTRRARLHPRDITVVEAHGTGTQAGDPAEYHSVRDVFGGPKRAGKLALGSAKGLVGHTEGVSGMVALAKVVMMIHGGQVPPQPGFETLNPNIRAMPDDHIEINKHTRPWKAGFRAALINNYGACGSNATMVITQGPQRGRSVSRGLQAEGVALPFRLCALDKSRLQAYAARLRQFITPREDDKDMTLANLAYNVALQSNPSLDCKCIFRAKSIPELAARLARIEQGEESDIVRGRKSIPPVILCFGGQVGRSVGLNRVLYDAVPLLRHHLEACDDVLKNTGQKSIFPGIFSSALLPDPVQLQTQLFSLQYACARSWICSGIQVAAVIGHSFGELTALCISGVLSLSDALTIIVRRAEIIRDNWSDDAGAMLAVEGDKLQIDQYLDGSLASVACYNGPRSFTIAGPTSAVDELQSKLEVHSAIRTKRLDVTNAFHSTLVDPLLPALQTITDGVLFHAPSIHLERAIAGPTEAGPTEGIPTVSIIADHLRQPVHFRAAVQRLASRYDSAVWLEAGSNSTVTSLARKALDTSALGHSFHALNITSNGALGNLVSITIELWKDHIPCEFLGHHALQGKEYSYLFLPPYQFERSRHWMENKPLPAADQEEYARENDAQNGDPLFSFSGYVDSDHRAMRYSIHTNHPQYIAAVSGHVAARTAPIAPASVLLDYAVELLRSLPEGKDKVPCVWDVGSDTPLLLDSNRDVWIELLRDMGSRSTWELRFLSEETKAKGSRRLLHCTARITVHDASDGILQAEFARYSRLVSHRKCVELLSDPNVDDILQGRNVYRAFAEIVEYSEAYRGVQKLVGKGDESAGCVLKSYSGRTWADAFLCDSFSQCGGFWVNCMTDRDQGEIYVASRMEKWVRTPLFSDMASARPSTWHVWARHHRADSWYTSDIFVFTPGGELVEMFLGVRYSRVAKSVFVRLLGGSPSERKDAGKQETVKPSPTKNLDVRVREVVAEFCAVEPSEIQDNSQLADAGVDSLMAMELARELEQVFQCTLAVEALLEADTLADLTRIVRHEVGHVKDSRSEHSSYDHTASSRTSEGLITSTESITSVSETTDLLLPQMDVVQTFGEIKARTDEFLADNQCSGRLHDFTPLQIELCLVLTLEAFNTLGSDMRSASPNQRLARIEHDSQHESLVRYLYDRLLEAGLVILEGATVIRTEKPAPSNSSTAILSRIETEYPDYAGASRLTFYTGGRLAEVLRGKQDGLELIFGTQEGQRLVSWMYGEEPHNVAGYKLMGEFIKRLVQKLALTTKDAGPLKILEMGAGTGGGTKWFLPLLAALPIAVEYTFSDISPAFLAQARRNFRDYSFIRYCVHDIEKPPADELQGSQHIIIASNAVHATSNLQESTKHMRQALRRDGVLMMLEMTTPVFAIDLVFGLFRGWWAFNDGRTHAITDEQRWKQDLQAVGYGNVDWTDGQSNEATVQRVIFATAQRSRAEYFEACPNQTARLHAVEKYVRQTVEGFRTPVARSQDRVTPREACVLLTGGTGSLGSHLVAHLARLPGVRMILCLNQVSKTKPKERQERALAERKLSLSTLEQDKLVVLEGDTSMPQLGLTSDQYNSLQSNVTHIVHNAWPMDGIKPLSSFEGQFRVLRNLIDLASDIVTAESRLVRFQLVSSIGTVKGGGALEEHTGIDKVMTNGYNEAKFVCERVLQETLQRYPEIFQAMIVRPGQIAGSQEAGYWNTHEHFPAMVKSSQTLGVFPALEGGMAWTPVDLAAKVMSELLIENGAPESIYHVDNPAQQDWASVVNVLAEELGATMVPFKEWLRRVRQHGVDSKKNPASLMADWVEDNFQTMSCQGAMDTRVAKRHSKTLRQMQKDGQVRAEMVRKYVLSWKERGFLT